MLRPVGRPGVDRETLLARWRHLPKVDVEAFRRDVDGAVDPAL
ncbi:MAG TPA: hypothetical protein VMT16_13135 [Thermoanaerobaculia bacterium]|nr:hypothetical protein [Thermoanaerobaculia bacterium]